MSNREREKEREIGQQAGTGGSERKHGNQHTHDALQKRGFAKRNACSRRAVFFFSLFLASSSPTHHLSTLVRMYGKP